MPPVGLVVPIILVAAMAGIAVVLIAQWPTRRDLATLPVARAQRVMRRYSLILGWIEAAALVALVVALLRLPPGSTEMWLVGAAAVCVAVMMGVWAAWLRPLNTAIAAWPPEEPPADWERHHRRWSTLHRVRMVLAIIALALLLMGVMARPAL